MIRDDGNENLNKDIKLRHLRFASYAWLVLGANIGVILWGAYVRASGSGAGCGSHWPLCNGRIVPRDPSSETLVELSHRLSSGVALLLVVGMAVWAWRSYERGHVVRRGAALSLFFIITEALVGAGLVLFQLVADNASIARATFMAVHLSNTFLLLAALALTGWWASGGQPTRLRGQGGVAIGLLAGCAGMILLGASGAVTALGDTLFPSKSLAEGLRADFSPTAHFLIRLRIYHPAIAIGLGCYLTLIGWYSQRVRPSPETRRLSLLLAGLFVLQLVLGALNVLLQAPIPMQIMHLLLADGVWIALVLLTAAYLGVGREASPAPVRQPELAYETR
jgi:heme A synthase